MVTPYQLACGLEARTLCLCHFIQKNLDPNLYSIPPALPPFYSPFSVPPSHPLSFLWLTPHHAITPSSLYLLSSSLPFPSLFIMCFTPGVRINSPSPYLHFLLISLSCLVLVWVSVLSSKIPLTYIVLWMREYVFMCVCILGYSHGDLHANVSPQQIES